VVPGALLHIAAILMHQLAVFFYPAALAFLWRRSRERFARDAILYTAICAGGTLAIYFAAYRLTLHLEAPGFRNWLTYHSAVPFFFHPWKSVGWLWLGTGRLFVGGKLTRSALVLLPPAVTLAAVAIVELVRERNRLALAGPAWPLAVWCVSYLCFLFVWEPYNTFYRLFYLVPLVALAALATREIRPRSLACLAAALLLWNFCAFIYPYTRVESNRPLAFALDQRKNWPAGTGIVFSRFVPDLWTISYFNPQVAWISMEQPDPARLAAYSEQFQRQGDRLYVDWTYLQRAGQPAPRFRFQRIVP
jgi:hypothetical protein